MRCQRPHCLILLKDPFVAATFALHQVGEVDSDSALFKLNINQPYVIKVTNQEEADKIIQSLHIEYFNNKPEITTLIKSSLFRGLVDGFTCFAGISY